MVSNFTGDIMGKLSFSLLIPPQAFAPNLRYPRTSSEFP
jgi:hypothetical protein